MADDTLTAAQEANTILKRIQKIGEDAHKHDEKAAEERAAAADKQEEQLELDKRIEALTQKADDRRKQQSTDDKVAQAEQLEKLDELGITNSDVADTVLADLKNNVTWSDEELKQMADDAKALSDRDKRDAKDKRKKEKLEEQRLAANLKAEASLSGLLQLGFINKENADRLAKKAMQMKESVHKWWEDKKEKMASGAKSILQWLMTAAGLAIIWGIFKLLAKVDWVKLYDDMKLWIDLIWTGLTRFFAFKGIKAFSKWLKNTKFVRFLTAAFRSVINLIKLVLGGGLRGLLKVFNFLTKGIFSGKGMIGKRILAVADWFTGKGKNTLPRKIMAMWKNAVRDFNKAMKFGKAWIKGITDWFSGKQRGSLPRKIMAIWKNTIRHATKALAPVTTALKAAVQPLLSFFQTGKNATGVGGIFTKIKNMFGAGGKIMGLVSKAKGFLTKALGIFGKLFAPITVFMAAWAAISGGLDEAEKESGGFPQKILAFISGALKGLIDFFVFDLANLIQDGIKWAIGWVMGLFGFSEKEIEKATDFDFVKPIKDAVFKAIDWLKNLFSFKDTSLKGLFTSFIDIVTAPIGLAVTFLKSIFKWGDPDEPFSLGKLITDTIGDIIAFMKDFLNPKKILEKLNPLNWFGGDDSKEEIQAELAAAKKGKKNIMTGKVTIDEAKVKELEEKLAKMATGGMIMPGGAAIVGEGSMAGELVVNAASAAKVIPAKLTESLMSGIGGGQNFAPTTVVNSAPTSSSTIMASSSINPISQKYFRSD